MGNASLDVSLSRRLKMRMTQSLTVTVPSFQERLLSRRTLSFVDGTMFFQCSEATGPADQWTDRLDSPDGAYPTTHYERRQDDFESLLDAAGPLVGLYKALSD